MVLWSPAAWSKSNETPVAWINLQYSLIRSGFDQEYITKVFKDPRAEFLPNVVTKIAYLRKEKAADYSHFLKAENVEKGRRFLAAQNRLLTQAENTYGVSKEVITAILTVESDLGNKTGNYPVFNVFSSLAVMDTPEVINSLSLDTRLMGRLQKKAAWGKSELCCFSHLLPPESPGSPVYQRLLGRSFWLFPIPALEYFAQWRGRQPGWLCGPLLL